MSDSHYFTSEQAERLKTHLAIIKPIIHERDSRAIKNLLDHCKVDSVALEIGLPLS
jgi:hypothetical protein